ncbi:MAG: UvrD-helicase domain-containing protein, partial [Verrucomicrobia bacterium]|nr:UvrD-helicase domain-containing protein [Verrucomicrobiota bacterium]
FMVGVLRAFPMELGVAPEFNVMNGDGTDAAQLRAHVLRTLFSHGDVRDTAQRDFLEAYKRATFGREEKSAFERLDAFVEEYHALYREQPAEVAWGHAATIWPDGPAWPLTAINVDATCAAMRAHATAARWDAKVMFRWETFIAAATDYSPEGAWPKELNYLFEKLAAVLPDLQRGAAEITLDRKPCALDTEGCRLALALLRHIVTTELRARLESTAGLHQLLARYEGAYDAWSRRTGTMSFTDAQYLLTSANRQSGGLVLSRQPDTAGRLYIDYRLDARLDHWLLDEFQDTSDLQWSAIRNLADEILQTRDGSRSFFYVGDVKQAIYGWRGGNPLLFGNILHTYAHCIRPEHLSISFRSCQPVLDCVNAVFDDITSAGLPAKTAARWTSIWQSHAPRPEGRTQPGYATLIEPPTDGKTKPTDAERYQLAAAVVRELDPVANGLTVALLVRTNAHGLELVDALRHGCPGLPVVHEGHAPLRDNPVVALLMALIRFALHPGDALAWRHLQMSPLYPDLATTAPPAELPILLLRDMQTNGHHAFLRHWGAALHRRVTLDAFGQRRLQDMLTAASEFDATSNRDVAAFLRFLDDYEIAESATGQPVRVMTIHQSKGLGFDVVILPDLQGRAMDRAHDVDIVAPRDTTDLAPRWVLRMPRKPVAECDPVLRDVLRAEDETASFGELCVLYVALTRAKRATYAITGFAGRTAETLNAAALLKQQLTGDSGTIAGTATAFTGVPATTLYETGARTWFSSLQPPRRSGPEKTPPAQPPAAINLDATPPPVAPPANRPAPLIPVEPSAHESPMLRPAARLFDREARDVLDFGREIHTLFEGITWLDDASAAVTIDRRIATWEQSTLADSAVRQDVTRQFRACLKNPDVRAIFNKPTTPTDLWREQRFELLLEHDEWVRGAFDRVAITLDTSGVPTAAAIIDFKSDRVTNEAGLARAAEGYQPQLALYARALSRILAIPRESIRLTLLFTRTARLRHLTPQQHT